MIRNVSLALERLEKVTAVIEQAVAENQAISVAYACRIAGISQSYIYYLIDNIDDMRIEDQEIIERFEYAKYLVKDVILQEFEGVINGNGGNGDQEKVENSTHEANASRPKNADSALNIARNRLQYDGLRWKLSRLMPKNYGENIQVNHNHVETKQLEVVSNLSLDDLRKLASMRIEDKSNRDD